MAPDRNQFPTTADKVAHLRQPSSYPEPATRVEARETHMSWVFLTDRHAYKMKKPVKLTYLDFAALESRRHFCLESLRLNRRLAGDVYLDVLPLTCADDGSLKLDGTGEPVEWLEKMVRLPGERMLDRMLEHDREVTELAPSAAELLGDFYARRTPRQPRAHLRQLACDVHDNVRALSDPGYGLPRTQVEALGRELLDALDRGAELFQARVTEGHIVEGHGDLRPEHVCLTAPPVVIDCLEFNRRLRTVDAVDELAYLSLEVERLGGDLEAVLFEPYCAATGDPAPQPVVSFYKVHRAMLRAKLAVWHLDDGREDQRDKWIDKARDYLDLAERHAGRLNRALP